MSDFDDFLDEIYGVVEICGLTYSASVAIKNVDPVAYRCAEADWEDSREDEDGCENGCGDHEEDEEDDDA